jgi:hypothetical protein
MKEEKGKGGEDKKKSKKNLVERRLIHLVFSRIE